MKLSSAILAGAALLVASSVSAQEITGDPAAGEKVFKKCMACHAIDGKNKVGPHLDGVYGRTAGSVEDFQKKYSNGIKELGAGGLVWNAETLTQYLPAPKDMVDGSKMTFKLTKPADIENVIAYLAQVSGVE
ncbi:cytochrome c family protein [Oricola sp.]|uniref:c-type cytochrome n=1 Tax=Oricola sp. TaxID=1979950 RepID=UPI0025FD31F5|nr:cytochrome c family protein [Oricola sp.]MCI5076091.1 cytochrome c family protein [Oricola sp.]